MPKGPCGMRGPTLQVSKPGGGRTAAMEAIGEGILVTGWGHKFAATSEGRVAELG